eukprot:scaffold173689_cov26-Tisochrysis_lutea.AAC.1
MPHKTVSLQTGGRSYLGIRECAAQLTTDAFDSFFARGPAFRPRTPAGGFTFFFLDSFVFRSLFMHCHLRKLYSKDAATGWACG